uniref:Uncharacterized protein n=1 Tax=Oryza punctata TaxID=4537 RepID=A0A0E0KAI8_ORYPU
MLDLWKGTHMKDDKWSNTTAKDVYVRIFLMSYKIVQYYHNIFRVNRVTCSFLLFLGNCTQKISDKKRHEIRFQLRSKTMFSRKAT